MLFRSLEAPTLQSKAVSGHHHASMEMKDAVKASVPSSKVSNASCCNAQHATASVACGMREERFIQGRPGVLEFDGIASLATTSLPRFDLEIQVHSDAPRILVRGHAPASLALRI